LSPKTISFMYEILRGPMMILWLLHIQFWLNHISITANLTNFSAIVGYF
jgi:hypothetical protein